MDEKEQRLRERSSNEMGRLQGQGIPAVGWTFRLGLQVTDR